MASKKGGLILLFRVAYGACLLLKAIASQLFKCPLPNPPRQTFSLSFQERVRGEVIYNKMNI